MRLSNRDRALETRSSHCWGEAGAARKVVLGKLSAAQAARLAPAEQACGLAVLEAVVSNSVVALAAGGTDRKVTLHAAGEFVVVNAAEAERLLAASILLLANILGIGQCSLVIRAACTSGRGLQARISRAGSETSATVQSRLWLPC